MELIWVTVGGVAVKVDVFIGHINMITLGNGGVNGAFSSLILLIGMADEDGMFINCAVEVEVDMFAGCADVIMLGNDGVDGAFGG
jgi:hypothetical protein